jgi:hypothetical protein
MRQLFNIDYTGLSKLLFIGFWVLLFQTKTNAQILFAQDCFVGGVTVAGVNRDGGWGDNKKCLIKWEENNELYRAYVVAYRYGRPEPHSTYINGAEINWNDGNQAGPEHIEDNDQSDFYAPHAIDITDILELEDDTLVLDFPQQTFYDHSWNWGWCGMYVVILYKSPDINTPICNRLYITDQKQDIPQGYTFQSPQISPNSPLVLSLFTSRITSSYSDFSRVLLNSTIVGDIWGDDLVIPAYSGAQGSFYYQGSDINGLNGDTMNNVMHHHDATAVINEYLNGGTESLVMYKFEGGDSNPHSAFTLTYTPECPIVEVDDIPRSYRYCRGDSTMFQASGYDNFEWTPSAGLSDNTIANPVCSADSSGWYQVRMWNNDGCSQTIPVHVEVTDIPQPENVVVTPSICPQFTGQVIAQNVPGAQPIVYTLNGDSQNNGSFTELESGTYDLNITTSDGCEWDTAVVVNMNPIHQAAFNAKPESGYTPLDVFFNNESTTNSTGFQWLVDDVPVSTQDDFYESFDEAGSYQIELIAFRGETFCADTASFTLLVEEGLTLIIPNIITPNGDGLNDTLLAQSSGVAYARWEVLNRWGNLLYSSEATSPDSPIMLWGPEKGEYPAGVYTIILSARGNSGQQKSYTVMVTMK